ncbi:hypothetical protein KSS87_000031, partial [Heliosperma pusillum]
NLQELVIMDFDQLVSLPSLNSMECLRTLEIRCPALISLPDDFFHGLSALDSLYLCCHRDLRRLPSSFEELTSLQRIWIYYFVFENVLPTLNVFRELWSLCIPSYSAVSLRSMLEAVEQLPNISVIGIEGFQDEQQLREYFSDMTPFLRLQSLKELILVGCSNIRELPEQLGLLTKITTLSIWLFDDLEEIPDWLSNLSSLETLDFATCGSLRRLPSKEAMLRLTQLRELVINSCPLLKESYLETRGLEWHKVEHLRYIENAALPVNCNRNIVFLENACTGLLCRPSSPDLGFFPINAVDTWLSAQYAILVGNMIKCCYLVMFESMFMTNRSTLEVTGTGDRRHQLYYLHEVHAAATNNIAISSSLQLWHRSLGHRSVDKVIGIGMGMVDEKTMHAKRNSMPPDGVSTWSCTSQRSLPNVKPERLYRVWPGNNRFLCGGRLVLGPDAGSLYLSSFLIGCPAVTFCIRMAVRIREHDPLYGYGVLTAGIVLTFLDFLFLYMTCARDPGIVPRNFRPPDEDDLETPTQSMEWALGRTINQRAPRTKDVVVNGYTVKVKFCETCKLYRPPRASHCSICNNCVQRFDHHCPWVGQCIGLFADTSSTTRLQRNYRFFILFISSSTFLCLYVFTFSLINLLRKRGTLMNSMSDDVVSVILVCYCFVVVWFVGGLTVFHFYLMSTNQTTYENFRYRYDKNKNPYNLGVIHNLKQLFLTRIPPSAVNFREMVLVQDVFIPETPSYRNGQMSIRRNIDKSIGNKLTKNSGRVISAIRLQNVSLGVHSAFGQSFQNQAPFTAHRRSVAIVKVSADPEKTNLASGNGESTNEEERVGIQNLPLESKLQLKLEQKMKMKLDKKIRLRRKRLVRKRIMRKKGRWPPSKMKKLKNV